MIYNPDLYFNSELTLPMDIHEAPRGQIIDSSICQNALWRALMY